MRPERAAETLESGHGLLAQTLGILSDSAARRDVGVGLDVLIRAQQLSFWDAMILTSAERLGCEVIWSEDLDAGQTLMGVRVQNPSKL